MSVQALFLKRIPSVETLRYLDSPKFLIKLMKFPKKPGLLGTYSLRNNHHPGEFNLYPSLSGLRLPCFTLIPM